jgi:hypothetical protein
MKVTHDAPPVPRRQLPSTQKLTILTILSMLGLSLSPALAFAQLSRVGQTQGLLTLPTGFVLDTDVDYDPVNNVFLSVGAGGSLGGAWTNSSGAIVPGTSAFAIGTTGNPNFAFAPSTRYSPDVNGGQGGFLVTWNQTSGTDTFTHAAVVAFPAGQISPDRIVSVNQPVLHTQNPAMAYSATSHRFLVAWQTKAGGSIQGLFIDVNGVPLGSIMTFEPGCSMNPGLDWNAATDDFGLSVAGYCSGAYVGFRRVAAATGAVSARTTFGFSSGTFSSSVVVNASTRHFVVGWYDGANAKSAELDETGALLGSSLISNIGSADGLALAFNATSGTILSIGQGNSYEVLGVELDGKGVPISSKVVLTNGGGTIGSFGMSVTEHAGTNQWNVTYARQHLELADQIVQTATSQGGPVSNVQMALDTPSNPAFVRPTFFVGGWAIDRGTTVGTGVDAVHLWAYPAGGGAPIFAGAITTFGNRADVASAFGGNFQTSGFGLMISLPVGAYTLAAYPHSAITGAFGTAKTIAVSVQTTRGSLDLPISRSTLWQKLVVAGWAIDLSAPSGPGVDAVHVWAYPNPGSGQNPVFVGVTAYGGARPDVGGLFGGQFTASGFSLQSPDLPAGLYRVVAFAHSTVTGTFDSVATADVTIASAMTVDQPLANAVLSAGAPFAVSGWAVDRNATSDAGIDVVHVWAFGPGGATFLGMAGVGGARPDVSAILGAQFVNCGFWLTAPGLPPGTYTLVVYAHSTLTGTFNEGRAVRVTVQ